MLYASWYEKLPIRRYRGIAIWQSEDLESPNFLLKDTVFVKPVKVPDKYKQLKIGAKLLFIPCMKEQNIWHFDLFEYKGSLWMVSCGDMDDNILLSRSDDYKNVHTYSLPLVNNHYTETKMGERLYFYKPTAFVRNDSLHLYYTGNTRKSLEEWTNKLYYSVESMETILKEINNFEYVVW